MKGFHCIVVVAAIAATGCSRPASIVGKWARYLPADTKAAAVRNHEPIPQGDLVFGADGTCTLTVTVASRKTTFTGAYKLTGTALTVEGTETPGAQRIVENGVFSDDFATVRIAGKDFYRGR